MESFGDPDRVAFEVDLAEGQRVAVRLRSTETTGACGMVLFDAREERGGCWWLAAAPGAINIAADIGTNAHFMLMLDAKEARVCGYDLIIDHARDEERRP